jgi:hypothetical protein
VRRECSVASFVTDDFQTTYTTGSLVLPFNISKVNFYYRTFIALFLFFNFWKTVRLIVLN